jgi:hypothetical protein
MVGIPCNAAANEIRNSPRGATSEFLQRYPEDAEVECLLARLGTAPRLTRRGAEQCAISMFHAESTLEIPGTAEVRIPGRMVVSPAVVMAATPPIVPLMPPSLDHALIGHGLIGATRGHRACRRQRRGPHAAGESTGQKGRRTQNDELTHVIFLGKAEFSA